MDINQDIDSLLQSINQQFSCIQTQDREVLVSELQKVIGGQLSTKDCEFFLDMNNWNLQGAVWSYFEYYQAEGSLPVVSSLPRMSVVQNEPSVAGIQRDTRTVLPGQTFTQAWRIMNSGMDRWPPGCSLRHFSGPQMAMVDRLAVDGIEAGGTADIQLLMTAPAQPGVYTSQWRMTTPTGTYFGELLCIGLMVTTTAPHDEDVTARFSSLMAHDPSVAPPTTALSNQSDQLSHLQSFSDGEQNQLSTSMTGVNSTASPAAPVFGHHSSAPMLYAPGSDASISMPPTSTTDLENMEMS